jgi:hypothetical protein
MKPLADNLATTHNDGPDQRIGTDPPPPPLRKLQSPPQVLSIRICELGVHATD